MKIHLLAGTIIAAASLLAACSDSSNNNKAEAEPPPVEDPIPPSTPLAKQSAAISIADPGGAEPVVTIVSYEGREETATPVVAITAEVITPGAGGAGTIDLVLSATNNAVRSIPNSKAVVDTAASDLGTATITDQTGTVDNEPASPNFGEPFVYFGEALMTPPGATRDAIDTFEITLGGAAADPLVIELNLPTEDVGIITTQDSEDEEEIVSIDTGVGGDRVVGNTGAYVYVDFDDNSSNAANATEGFLSADGRYTYVGHKTNPYIMILDNNTGTVDAVALLGPPEEPYESGQAARIASVDSVVKSPDGQYLYATVLDGAHPYSASGCAYDDADGAIVQNWIFKVELSSMSVVGELDVSPPGNSLCSDSAVLKRLSMSSDGSIGATAMFNKGRVVIVNLDTMTEIKSLIVNGPADDKEEPHYTAVSPDGSKVYVAYNDNDEGSLDVIDTSDFSITQLEISAPTSDRTHDLRFGPDGRLYYLRDDSTNNPLYIFDLSTTPVTEVAIAGVDLGNAHSESRISFSPYGDYYYFITDGPDDLYKFGLADDMLSADSPLNADSSANHLAVPTLY